MYSELVRNLEVLLKYSSKPSSASGLPLETALKSLSLSKRFGSFWLGGNAKHLGAEHKSILLSSKRDSVGKEGGSKVRQKKASILFLSQGKERD